MIVIDTSAVIAVLVEEDEAVAIERCLAVADRILMGAPTKFEMLMVATKWPNGIKRTLELLALSGIEVVDWTDELTEIAAGAFQRFGKGLHPARLNFGDCMSYALAKSLDAPLLYKGGDFAQMDIRSAL